MTSPLRFLSTLALAALALLAPAAPARAHKQSMYLSVGPVRGSTSPLVIASSGGLRISQ